MTPPKMGQKAKKNTFFFIAYFFDFLPHFGKKSPIFFEKQRKHAEILLKIYKIQFLPGKCIKIFNSYFFCFLPQFGKKSTFMFFVFCPNLEQKELFPPNWGKNQNFAFCPNLEQKTRFPQIGAKTKKDNNVRFSLGILKFGIF